MLNKLQLIGHLGADPEFRVFPEGGSVCTINVATTEHWKDKQGQDQSHTEWTTVVYRNKLAEIANKILTKGDLVFTEGTKRTRKWHDNKQNVDRYSVEMMGMVMRKLPKASKPGATNDQQQDYSDYQSSDDYLQG